MSNEAKDERVANKGMQGGDGIREVAKNAQLVGSASPGRKLLCSASGMYGLIVFPSLDVMLHGSMMLGMGS